jgi:DNA-binding CsgD family transcriptional regulator
MSRDKPPESFSSGDAPPEDRKCPICGAWESKGGCENPSICARALAKMETDYSRDITELPAKKNERSLHLLMAGLEALNLLNIGLAVTTASGQILMSNRSFDQMLAANDGLELSSGGVLQAQEGSSPLFSELLESAHIHAAAGKVRQPAAIAVTRPSGKRPLPVYIRSTKSAVASDDSAAPSVLVFVMDPELSVEAAETDLRQLYGLTQTEARVANLLMEGKTLDESCQQLAIRRSTGRTHIQHLFEKVGVKRQSELVSVLWKSVGLVRTKRGNKEEGKNRPTKRAGLNDVLFRMLVNRAFPGVDGIEK